MDRIDAKVAALIDNTQLAFNAGGLVGVQVGYQALVVRDIDVDDPDTDKSLGVVRLIRVRLEVNHVQDNLCVARVVEYQGKRPLDITTVRKRKQVAIGPAGQTTDACVYVSIGETAVIRPPEPESDEPPF